jgi:hypothetical protein
MEITLTTEESGALQKALSSYSTDLRMEIADTDNPGYRRDLRAERTLLESVIAKLDTGARASGLRDGNGRVVVRLVGVWSVD